MLTLTAITSFCVNVVSKILLAVIVYFVGSFIIKKLMNILSKTGAFTKMDQTVHSFTLNFIKTALYILLIVSVISILGVPMASIVAAIASAGLAIGMALQGALSNIAGGFMLLIFRPFKLGDYIVSGSGEGTVSDITMVYTILKTVDNRTITIPNGNLMNESITNMSTENTRRVDLTFSCAKGEDVSKIQNMLLGCCEANDNVLKTPAPFARVSGGTNNSMEFTVRAWVNGADYWNVHFDLIQSITEKMIQEGIQAPATRVITETK